MSNPDSSASSSGAQKRPFTRARTRTEEGLALLASALKDNERAQQSAVLAKAQRAYELLASAGDVRAASALQLVGQVHLNRQECEPAASAFERALAIREKALGPDDHQVADSLRSLAEARRCAGDDERAITLLRRAYDIESADPARIRERVEITVVLADVLQKHGELRRALALLRDTLVSVDSLRGPQDPLRVELLGPFTTLLRALGDKESADALWAGLPEADYCLPEPCTNDSTPHPGTVSNAATVVAGLSPAFKSCYTAGLEKDPRIVGKMRVSMIVAPDGSVSHVKGHQTGYLGESVANCVLKAALGAKFAPPSGGSAVVMMPVRFVAAAKP